MNRIACPTCGKMMIDPEGSVRFRCQFCGVFFTGWEEELHEKLKEIKNEELVKWE